MPADSFICGECQAVFHNITDFVNHKNAGCSRSTVTSTAYTTTFTSEDTTETLLLEETIDSKVKFKTAPPSSIATTNQQIFSPASNYNEIQSNNEVGKEAIDPVYRLIGSGMENEAPTVPMASIQHNILTSQQIPDATPLNTTGTEENVIVEENQNNLGGNVASADTVTFSQVGEDGQTIYSYVLTKEQLAQLGIQTEDDMVGLTDSSQVTLMVSPQPMQEGIVSAKTAQSADQVETNYLNSVNVPTESSSLNTTDPLTRIRLVPVESSSAYGGSHAIVVKTAKEIQMEEAKNQLSSSTCQGSGKKRGRPKKGTEKSKSVVLPEPTENVSKRPLPERDIDGMYTCSSCKKAFKRERHYKTHRCISWDDYVDISKSETIDNMDKDSGEEDTDQTRDFVLRDFKSKKSTTSTITVENDPGIIDKIQLCTGQEALQQNVAETNDLTGLRLERVIDSSDHDMPPKKRKKNKTYSSSPRKVEDLPIFTSEQDKIDFDAAMNVDLSFVDVLYSSHHIAQDVNSELAPPNNFRSTKSLDNLTVYTCNECKRVFMSQSHCRLHCVSHTDAKPFKCIKCDYSTNAKGHLYTHIRLHTGQMYKCSKCNFSTGNKTHLIEHEDTHSDVKHTCRICKKEYSTKKSLVNHVRVYHTDTEGKDYLMEFMVRGPRNKVSMLHQCYMCNRKFKKRTDRDRHLFCHNIRDVSTALYACDLCSFTTYRQSYLDKHYLKHRIVYICALCGLKFPSTVRLNEHLSEKHNVDGNDDNTYEAWKEMFEKCIESSLYLKEALVQAVVEVEKIQEGDEFHYVTKDVSATTNPDLVQQPSTTDPGVTAQKENGGVPNHMQIQVAEHGAEASQSGSIDESIRAGDGQNVPGSSATATQMVNNTEENQDAEKDSVEVEDKDYFSGLTLEEEQEATLNLEEALDDQEESVNVSERESGVPQLGMTDDADEEAEIDTSDPKNDIPPAEACKTVFKRLNYEPLTMEKFQYVRQIYGNEECEYCGRLFYLHSEYEPHLKMHTGDKPFVCDQCDFRAISKYTLRRHVQREHEQVIFKCSACDYEGTCRTQLWTHQKQMHSGIAAICTICSAEFPDFKLLRAHLSLKHKGLDPDEKHKMVFPSSKNQVGRRVYKCPHCEKTFLRAYADFQKHLWIHEGIRPFKCSLCTYACRSATNLKAHMLKHSNDKPFLCNECGKAYKSKTALRWHVRTHKYGKAFKCTKCNYQAIQKSHLTRHMETHDIVKAHVCQHCDFSANTLGYMKIHYTRFHKGCFYNPDTASPSTKQMDPNTKVYKCAYCEYLFGNMAEMKRHLRSRHNMRETEVCDIAEQQIIAGEEIDENEIVAIDITQDEQIIHVEENEIIGHESSHYTADSSTVQVIAQDNDPTTAKEFQIQSSTGQIITVKQLTGDPKAAILDAHPVGVTIDAHNPNVIVIDNEETMATKTVEDNVIVDTTAQHFHTGEELIIDTQEQASVLQNEAINRNVFSSSAPVVLNGKQYLMSSSEVLTGHKYSNNELIVQYVTQNEVQQPGSGTNVLVTGESNENAPVLIKNSLQNLPISIQNSNVHVMESGTFNASSHGGVVNTNTAKEEGVVESQNDVVYVIKGTEQTSAQNSVYL